MPNYNFSNDDRKYFEILHITLTFVATVGSVLGIVLHMLASVDIGSWHDTSICWCSVAACLWIHKLLGGNQNVK